jgi:hypothetical protein
LNSISPRFDINALVHYNLTMLTLGTDHNNIPEESCDLPKSLLEVWDKTDDNDIWSGRKEFMSGLTSLRLDEVSMS